MNIFPTTFKRALITGLPKRTDEIILETLYNSKCITPELLWGKLPYKNEIIHDIPNYEKFSSVLERFYEKGWITKGRALDKPETKSGGYKVKVEMAYKERLPLMMMDLDPLPPIEWDDLIYHLILYKGVSYAYQIYDSDTHTKIDKLYDNTIYFIEKHIEDIPACFAEKITQFDLKLNPVETKRKIQIELGLNDNIPQLLQRKMLE